MGKILIIKRVSNDFDRFICKEMKNLNKSIDIVDAFRFHGRISRKIINIIKKHNFSILFPIFLQIDKKMLFQYDQIILFDDFPDLPLIKWIKNKNPKSNIKLWFWNIPNYSIDEYKKYCKMYCFDKEYCEKNSIEFIDQFYLEKQSIEYSISDFNCDVLYIGVDKNRSYILKEMVSVFKEKEISYNIKLITNLKKGTDNNIEYRRKHLPYEDVLSYCIHCKAIIELVDKNQMGLTWRALEALFLKKKLITNNKSIKLYDFYDKNNIFIYGEDSLESLKNFIETPFKDNEFSKNKKYTFEHWYNTITKESVYEPKKKN